MSGPVPPVPFRNGQRVTSDDERLNYATAKLAAQFWRGGGDESYHFLLYLCAETVRTVQAATDEYDARSSDTPMAVLKELVQMNDDLIARRVRRDVPQTWAWARAVMEEDGKRDPGWTR